ncbi:MAG: helix-turn-helix transcriptional regulator [Alphaproteobacteria bacterium]|nr:helix-turn-helix transcriptional regulator [Alphaproteobacteria bacterium]
MALRRIAAPALAGLFPACLGAAHLGDLLDRLLADLEALHGTLSPGWPACKSEYRIVDRRSGRAHDAEFTLCLSRCGGALKLCVGRHRRRTPASRPSNTERDTPADIARVAESPLFFGERNMLAFPARLLDAQVAGTVPAGDASPPATRGAQHGPVADIVEAVYRRLGQGDLNQGAIAADCGLSQRSLRRRLDRAGVTFRQLTEDARTQYALWALRETRLPVSEIAHRLGYDSQGAFARAFRKSTGTPPSGLRRGGRTDRRATAPGRPS